jgi:hypothetical protein
MSEARDPRFDELDRLIAAEAARKSSLTEVIRQSHPRNYHELRKLRQSPERVPSWQGRRRIYLEGKFGVL